MVGEDPCSASTITVIGKMGNHGPLSGALGGVRRVVRGEGSNVHSAPTSM
jgi:hypothetical protein